MYAEDGRFSRLIRRPKVLDVALAMWQVIGESVSQGGNEMAMFNFESLLEFISLNGGNVSVSSRTISATECSGGNVSDYGPNSSFQIRWSKDDPLISGSTVVC